MVPYLIEVAFILPQIIQCSACNMDFYGVFQRAAVPYTATGVGLYGNVPARQDT